MRNEVVKLVRGYHKESRGPLTIQQVKKRLQSDLIFQYGECCLIMSSYSYVAFLSCYTFFAFVRLINEPSHMIRTVQD